MSKRSGFSFAKAVRQLVVVLVAVAVTLIAIEFTIRWAAPQPLNYYDFEVRDGGAALVAGNPTEARKVLPPGQGPYRPGHEYWMGKYLVHINQNGWRDVEHTMEKPEGAIRIGVIGDSVTFGTGVAIEDAYFRVLEDLLHDEGYERVEVLGFAGGASNAYFARLLAADLVDAYDLDAVILGFNQNDILPAADVESAARKVKARRKSNLMARMARSTDQLFRADSHLYHLFRERSKSMLRRVGIVDPNMTFQAFLFIEDDRAISAWDDTSRILSELVADMKQRDVPFLIAVFPVDMQVGPEAAELYRRQGFSFSDGLTEARVQTMVREFAAESSVPFADPLPRFQSDPDVVKFIRTEGGSVDWAHLNALGHRLAAESILDSIRERPDFLDADQRKSGRAGSAGPGDELDG